MNTCVSDDDIIVNIQGIRNVTWGESNSVSYTRDVGKPWFLAVTWKGNHQVFYYRTEVAARAIFGKLREAMDKTLKGEAK